jgi:hypothetical protein
MLQTLNIHLRHQISVSLQKRAAIGFCFGAAPGRGLLIAGRFDRLGSVARLDQLAPPNSRCLEMLVPDLP